MFKRPDREVSASGQAVLHLAVAALLGAGEPYDGFHGLMFAKRRGAISRRRSHKPASRPMASSASGDRPAVRAGVDNGAYQDAPLTNAREVSCPTRSSKGT